MIHTNRVVTVGDQESIIDKPIVLYRGDREVEVEFELVGNEFMFTTEGNVIKSMNASHGQLVLNTPSGDHMFSEVAECHDGKVVFVITKEMIDEFIEIGFYSFQIRLYDGADMKSRASIPPVFSGIDIRNPIAAEDETNVVDQAVVDYARIYRDQSNEELPTFDWAGNYIKTDWVHHDVITENKMNKIEDAIWTVNNKISESDNVFLKKAEQMEVQRQNDVNSLNAKDSELSRAITDGDRQVQNSVNILRVDMETGDLSVKKYVEDEVAEINSQFEYIKNSNSIYFDNYNPYKDNSGDNSEKLKSAIADCIASGKELLVSPGVYKFTQTIDISMGSKDFKIKGLTTKSEYHPYAKFYYNGEGIFLNFKQCRNVYFENMEISGFNRDVDTNCYKVGSIGLNLDGCIIAENCNLNGFETISKWQGGYYHKYINCLIQYSSICFSEYNANNLIIDKCKCNNFEIFLTVDSGDGPTVIRDSSFEKFTRRICESVSGNTSNILIEGCYIENYHKATPPSGLNGQFDKTIAITGFKSITLIGNNICTNGIKDFIYTNTLTENIISLGNRIMINKDDITTSGFRSYIWNAGGLKNVIANDVCYKVLSYEGSDNSAYIRGTSSILDITNIYDCFKGQYLTPPKNGVYVTKLNEYSVSNSILDFPTNCITITPINASFATSEGFPQSRAGVLKTSKSGSEYFAFKQEYTVMATSDTARELRYERYVTSSNEWTQWRSANQYRHNFYVESFTLNANSTHDVNVNVEPLIIYDSVDLVLFGASDLPAGVIYNAIKADENVLVIRFLNAANSNITIPRLRFALNVEPAN